MIATHSPATPKPRRWTVAVRIALITGLTTVVTFALALFAGIAAMALLGLVRGGAVDMANAYRHVALPVAIIAFVLALILGSRYEICQYRKHRDAWLRLR